MFIPWSRTIEHLTTNVSLSATANFILVAFPWFSCSTELWLYRAVLKEERLPWRRELISRGWDTRTVNHPLASSHYSNCCKTWKKLLLLIQNQCSHWGMEAIINWQYGKCTSEFLQKKTQVFQYQERNFAFLANYTTLERATQASDGKMRERLLVRKKSVSNETFGRLRQYLRKQCATVGHHEE